MPIIHSLCWRGVNFRISILVMWPMSIFISDSWFDDLLMSNFARSAPDFPLTSSDFTNRFIRSFNTSTGEIYSTWTIGPLAWNTVRKLSNSGFTDCKNAISTFMIDSSLLSDSWMSLNFFRFVEHFSWFGIYSKKYHFTAGNCSFILCSTGTSVSHLESTCLRNFRFSLFSSSYIVSSPHL